MVASLYWLLPKIWRCFFLYYFKLNAYDIPFGSFVGVMPFGSFVGVNNHGKTIFFGCALLQNEKNLCFSMVNEGMLFIL